MPFFLSLHLVPFFPVPFFPCALFSCAIFSCAFFPVPFFQATDKWSSGGIPTQYIREIMAIFIKVLYSIGPAVLHDSGMCLIYTAQLLFVR